MTKLLSVSFVICLFFANAFGQVDRCEEKGLEAFNPIPGTIPLSFGQMPSTDLICNEAECISGVKKGDVLTPTQAAKYYEKQAALTKCQWTLSELQPSEIENVWKDEIGAKVSVDDDKIQINDLDKVQYVSKGWVKLGSYRLTVNKSNKYGTPIQYTFILNKSIHNYLLRKNLLQKLGYEISPIKYIKRVKVQFDSKKQKASFLDDLEQSGTGSLDRFILSGDEKYPEGHKKEGQLKNNRPIVLQDLIAMEDQEFKVNLAKGYISPDIFEGKRVYKSLLIPFALTNVPESINMFDWTVGRIISENVKLTYPDVTDYLITSDDAVWMTKRILALTEADWWEIVDKTHLPPSVKVLLFHKLKSRRNHLGSLFSVKSVDLNVDPYVSNGNDLENGKIQQEFYEGYGRRFKVPDPQSPLSYSEMMSFLKSKAISKGIDLLVNAFNSADFMGTDISGKVQEFNEKILAEAVAESMTEDTVTKTPVKTFAFPTVDGNLIINREIIAGSYLGTDNPIQLVDTVGASISAGVFGGITGVYAKTGKLVTTASGVVRQQVPVDLSARTNVYWNRTYSHVRPITTVQKALKYPFKNMFVPTLKRRYGHYIDGLMDDFYKNLTPEQKIKVNNAFIDTLVERLSESRKKISKMKLKGARSIIKEKALAYVDKNLEEIKSEKFEFANIITLSEEAKEKLAKFSLEGDWKDNWYEEAKYCEDFGGKMKFDKKLKKDFCSYDEDSSFLITSQHILDANDEIGLLTKRHSWKLDHTDEVNEPEELVELFNQNLEIGESIIVTDSVGGNLGPSAGVQLYDLVKVRAGINTKKYVTSRLHFFRASETEIHVYKDLGNVNSIEATLGVQAFIPILKLTVRGMKGKGRTNFYKVNIGKKEDEFYGTLNKERVGKIRSLRNVLFSGSTQALDKVQKPVVVKHKFKEKNDKLGILVWRWNRLNQADRITVELPSGDSKVLYKRVFAKTRGVDYESYFNDLVSFLTSKIFDTEFNATSFSAGNPGFTYMGRAKNKVLSLEGFMENNRVEKPFVRLQRIVNGWKMKKDDVIEVLEEMKKKYRFRFFENEVLAQTKELFLYNINLNFYLYDTGIKHMMNLTKAEVEKIWKKFQVRDTTNFTGDDELKVSGISRFFNLKRRYERNMKKGKVDKAYKLLLKMVNVVDEKLSIAGIQRIYGGNKNFIALARLDGFRVGDENGDKVLFSNSFGRLGEYKTDGPIGKMRRFLGITNGEFTMSWLLGRVI